MWEYWLASVLLGLITPVLGFMAIASTPGIQGLKGALPVVNRIMSLATLLCGFGSIAFFVTAIVTSFSG